MESFLEILKYILPSLVVMATAYYLLDSLLKRQETLKVLEFQKNTTADVLPLKLQAYERLIILMERIVPTNLIPRLREENMTSVELQLTLINAIRHEYEHNIAQQMYVSDQTWVICKSSVEETISMINNSATHLENDASSSELSIKIIEKGMESGGTFPSHKAIAQLKKEVALLI